jgi:hypothetical protein
MRWTIGLIGLCMFLSACGPPVVSHQQTAGEPILKATDLAPIAAQYRGILSSDQELRSAFTGFSEIVPRVGLGGDAEAQLSVDGKAWSEMTRTQRDRLVKKAAVTFTDLFHVQTPRIAVVSVFLVDDLRTRVGWFNATNRGDFSYRLYSP